MENTSSRFGAMTCGHASTVRGLLPEGRPDKKLHAEAPRYENLSFGTSLGTLDSKGRQTFQLNDDRFRHTAIVGRTGSGKSNLVHQMEREDIQNGAGTFVLAAHEEDALYPLACVPEERLGDVVLLDFSNPAFLPRMNPLDVDTGDPRAVDKAIEDAMELLAMDDHYDWAGPRFEKMARDGLRLLLASPGLRTAPSPTSPAPTLSPSTRRAFSHTAWTATSTTSGRGCSPRRRSPTTTASSSTGSHPR